MRSETATGASRRDDCGETSGEVTVTGTFAYDGRPSATPSSSHDATRSRGDTLATRLEQGATALAEFARTLTTAEWETRVPRDTRKIGVTVHHVASMYPLEIDLTRKLAQGEPIVGVTWDDIAVVNASHAKEYDQVTKEAALALLARNSAAAAAYVRSLSDEELDRAAPVSLNANAPLTCQFFVEDHALRHSYHHLARMRATLQR